MTLSVLVINCGSSSIKYELISAQQETLLSGLAENLGAADARIKGRNEHGEAFEIAIPHANHAQALASLLQQLAQYQPQAIGHRVVHGGDMTQATRLTPQSIDHIRHAIPLAPLHNPANLIGIEATMQLFPQLPQVAVFDTAFHQTMPEHAYRYALPQFLYSEHQVRRYGFHGTSHAYVTERASELAGQKKSRWLALCTLGQWQLDLCGVEWSKPRYFDGSDPTRRRGDGHPQWRCRPKFAFISCQ